MLTKGGLKLANANEGQEDELAFAALEVRGPDRFLRSAWYRDIMETMFQHPEGEEEYRLEGGRLLQRGTDGRFRICLWEHEVPSAIAQCHTSIMGGHFGTEITLNRISENFWWPGMKQMVKDTVRRC